MTTGFVTRLSLAGFCATFVGNGIGRFAYIALMPALIQAGWFSKADASYLGAATLFGYLLGVPLGNSLTRFLSAGNMLRAAMFACSLSYLCCAVPGLPLPWYYAWRTLAGVGGAILMIHAGPSVVRQYAPEMRGRINGIVFAGIGMGAMVSGTLVPVLVAHGIAWTWSWLGALCLLLTLATWRAWGVEPRADAALAQPGASAWVLLRERSVVLLLAAYMLNAVGYLPHTLFWVDYIVGELKRPLATGGFFWATFGIGAAIGPLVTARLGERWGLRNSMTAGFLVKAVAVALPLVSGSDTCLFLSSLVVGIFTPGVAALVSAYTLECVGVRNHRAAWSMMTFGFAVAQALMGYSMAVIVARTGSYSLLFVISALSLVVSALCMMAMNGKVPLAAEAALKY